jgi:hypothetical protein
MSSLVIVNQAEEAWLDLITDVDMTLRLYQNNVTSGLTAAQIEALTQAAFTEANFAGYASSSMTTAWTTTQGNPSEATRAQVTFTRSSTGTVQNIFGYYVTRNSDGALQWFEHFDAPIPVEFINDAVIVTPRITLDDETGRNSVDKQVFTGSGTWNKPAGLKAVMVRLVGGGGSGGGCAATTGVQASEGAGGGGGGYSEKVILADDLGATETVTIGAGGAASAAGGAGNAGGTTSFGAHLQATGGAGGSAGVATGASSMAIGGVGGAGSSGDLNISGERGGPSLVSFMTNLSVHRRGSGGGSQLGATTIINSSAATSGVAGQTYGGGSTGAINGASQSARASLAGAPGVVIVDEFF